MPDPISRRQYATLADVREYSDITITDEDEAADQLSQAEEMIDSYVGSQSKHVANEFTGKATAGDTTHVTDTSSDTPLNIGQDGYFEYCEVEIIAGTNRGERRAITAYDQSENKVAVSPAFTAAIDSTCVYKIRQVGKFPRTSDNDFLDNIYYKSVPEAIRRATLAQLEYMLEKGSDFFSGPTDMSGESVGGDYSYTVRQNAERMISPVARKLLRGIMNRKGIMS